MLKRLYIKNYALFEELTIDFPGHLTVITGETGAGKSIFLEALGLTLGNRAESGIFHNNNEKCIIEAIFNMTKEPEVELFFKENDFDITGEIILRRELTPEGKSRVFINDSPASLLMVKQLGQYLIDIHSQHQTLLLNESRFQFQLIDSYSDCSDLKTKYSNYYSEYCSLNKKFEALKNQEAQAKKNLDYLRFQLNELNEISLENIDLNQLEEESKTLENAENIKSALNRASHLIDSDNGGLASQINSLKGILKSVEMFNSALKELFERVNSLSFEVKDISHQIQSNESDIDINPKRLEVVNETLDKLNHLFNKHSAKDINTLTDLRDRLNIQVTEIDNFDETLLKLEKQISEAWKQAILVAKQLHDKRMVGLPSLEKQVAELMKQLAMPNAKFVVENTLMDEIGPNGIDHFRFLFSANLGSELKPVEKVASGGELSRLMLCIKSILASKKSLPTIIFDEIDTGISGDVANKMGSIFNQMAKSMQVISITHLPQIASCGNHHLFVYKNDIKKKTVASIKQLAGDERIVEIAKMLSTDNPTESAIKNAKDLLNAN